MIPIPMWRHTFLAVKRQPSRRTVVTNPSGRIPYGISCWADVREGCVFLDRTNYITKLDNTANYACLWSPRRTGKTLFANQLALWHDKGVPHEKRLELFAETAIVKDPNARSGEYLVLPFDFSDVDDKNVEKSFTKVVNKSCLRFFQKYHRQGLLDYPVVIDPTDYTDTLESLASSVRLSGYKLFVIVDEVDSFANRLLIKVSHGENGTSEYYDFVAREGSVLCQFGRALKKHSSTCIKRMFFTGVLPVAWSDAFSSLNIVADLTHSYAFMGTLGLTDSEVTELLKQRYPHLSPEDRAEHLKNVKATCNAHRRSPAQVEGLLNTQGVWHYMRELDDKGEEVVPEMDPNVVQPARDEIAAFLVQHAAATRAYSPLHFVDDVIPFSPLRRFSAQAFFDPVEAPAALLSMAHYCGYLSYQHPRHAEYGDCLVALNEAMREVFVGAVVDTLPAVYKKAFTVCVQGGMARVEALQKVYKSSQERMGALPRGQ